jgi:integrase
VSNDARYDILSSSVAWGAPTIRHLDAGQLARLTEAFKNWHHSAPSGHIRRVRGRYWIVFLLLRYSGARIGEVLNLDDIRDIDYRHSELKIALKTGLSNRGAWRVIPVPTEVVSNVALYLAEFPGMRGKVLALDQGNFRREFYRRAEEADIPRPLSHPHILRHTRAIELLQAGVPLNAVQDLLGHVLTSTTVIYLQRSEVTVRKMLQDKGLL